MDRTNNDKKKPTVTINKGGPIKVSGAFTLTGANGDNIKPENAKEVYLCACGLSKRKPFCDGSHNIE